MSQHEQPPELDESEEAILDAVWDSIDDEPSEPVTKTLVDRSRERMKTDPWWRRP